MRLGYDPAEFHVERWLSSLVENKLDSSSGAIDAYSFTTFGRGPRTCISERFARAEIAVVLAGLVRRFEISFQGASGRGKGIEELFLRHSGTTHVIGRIWVGVREVEG